MKKLFIGVVVCVLATMCLFAQGTNEESSKKTEPNIVVSAEYIGNKNAAKDHVLTFSLSRDDTVASTYDDRRAYAEKVARKWADEHPEWGAEIRIQDGNQIAVEMSKTLTEATSGVAPDLLHLDSFYVGSFLDANVLEPLDKYVPKEDLDQFYDWTKDVTCKNGHQYALWCETDARLLYYRKDLVPNPPRTWDELISIGSKVAKETGKNGFLIDAGQSEGASNECTWAWFWAQGGTIFDEKDNRPILAEGANRQKLINVYAFMKKLIDSGASPQDIASWPGFDPIMAEVASDNVAMLVDGTWALGQIKQLAPNPSLWDYAPYPQKDKDSYSNSCGGWTYAVLTHDAARAQASIDFVMDSAAGKKAMSERCQIHAYIPTRTDVFEEGYFKNDPDQQRFAKELKNGHARPATSLYPSISDLNAKAMSKVLAGMSTPEQAVDDLDKEALDAWETWKRK